MSDEARTLAPLSGLQKIKAWHLQRLAYVYQKFPDSRVGE